jgi:hypothetical protein
VSRAPGRPSGLCVVSRASEQEFRDPAEARSLLGAVLIPARSRARRMGELRYSPVTSVLDRLRQVNRLDSASAVEVCDRARDLEGEVDRSRRKP